MRTEIQKMFDRFKKINEKLGAKRITGMENPNLPDYENEWEYHEYEKRLEASEESNLWSEYPF